MARRKKKILHNVLIKGIADRGKAVGRDAEGQVVFVENVVPGDVVDVLVLRKKKGVMQGTPVEFIEYSKDRIEAFCSHFEVCGGCKWQHLAYEVQLTHKETVVRDAIQRIAKVEVEDFQPILGSEQTQYYRNKLEFSFSNKRWLTAEELNTDISNKQDVLGFHRAGAFDKILDIDHCFLQGEPSNKLRNKARELAHAQGLSFYDAREHTGFMRNMIIRKTELGQLMLIVVFGADDMKKIKTFLDAMLESFPEITSLHYCINTKVNDFILDLDIPNYFGPEYVEEKLGDVIFRIGPKSFFQTNTNQAVRLFDVVADFVGLSGNENVYDLYSGIGSIALYLADKCKQVVGIEEVPAAIEDAKINQALNGISNAVFYAGDVRHVLSDEFAKKHGKPDVIITDPPRAGMHANVVEFLLKLEAPKIVYVSCNPGTQARDLFLLKQKYKVTKMRPVDMFPHTHHIENVALLELI